MPRNKPTGRPSAIVDADVRERMVTVVELGLPLKLAAEAVGIAYSTLRKYLDGTERPHDVDEQTFAEFMARLTRAKAIGAVKLAAEIATDPDWRAKAWIAERRYPDLFGKVERVEHSGVDGGPIATAALDVSKLPTHLVAELARAARQQREAEQEGAEEDGD